jgi:hypothetical protein
MRRVVFATAFLLCAVVVSQAQSAADMVAQQIGQLTIQNANLAEQLNRANAKVKELEAKLPKKEDTAPPEHNK